MLDTLQVCVQVHCLCELDWRRLSELKVRVKQVMFWGLPFHALPL